MCSRASVNAPHSRNRFLLSRPVCVRACVCVCVCVCSSVTSRSAISQAVTRQAPLLGTLHQEDRSALPFPSPEDLPTQGSSPGPLRCRQVLYHWSYREEGYQEASTQWVKAGWRADTYLILIDRVLHNILVLTINPCSIFLSYIYILFILCYN